MFKAKLINNVAIFYLKDYSVNSSKILKTIHIMHRKIIFCRSYIL